MVFLYLLKINLTMKKSILIAGSILLGSLVLGLLITHGMATDRYEHVESNVVFDKKTGITYFTDKKEYIDTKGDLYRYE
jgi:hypothetical protein